MDKTAHSKQANSGQCTARVRGTVHGEVADAPVKPVTADDARNRFSQTLADWQPNQQATFVSEIVQSHQWTW